MERRVWESERKGRRDGGVTEVRQRAVWSRGDCPELLFGDAAMECGLDGGPGVSDGSRGVVRVVVEVFNEFLGVKTRSSSGLQDERDQVDAGVSVDFFFSSRLAMLPGRALAADMSPVLAEKGVTTAVSM